MNPYATPSPLDAAETTVLPAYIGRAGDTAEMPRVQPALLPPRIAAGLAELRPLLDKISTAYAALQTDLDRASAKLRNLAREVQKAEDQAYLEATRP